MLTHRFGVINSVSIHLHVVALLRHSHCYSIRIQHREQYPGCIVQVELWEGACALS